MAYLPVGESTMVLLLVVVVHPPELQQYSYNLIDPFIITGGFHATKILPGGEVDTVNTDIESRWILPGAACILWNCGCSYRYGEHKN